MKAAIQQAHRYAVYLAPAEPFRGIGSRWLGRCADTGAALPAAPDGEAPPAAWTRAPAHYGLHATLKAPFRLAQDRTPPMLDAAARAFARGRQPFAARLALRNLRGFLAWCLDDSPAGDEGRRHMHALADDAVRGFDAFRAPPTREDTARRRPGQLGAAEREMLARWGYPYVFDTFTFHITLTGQLDPAAQQDATARLQRLAGGHAATAMPVARISLYVQPEPGADFVVARHYGFSGAVEDGAGAAWLGTAA